MKILLLLAALLPLSASAEGPSAYQQAEDCASGKCWLKKGPGNETMGVFAPMSRSGRQNLVNSPPKTLKIAGKDTPAPKKDAGGSGEPGFFSKAWGAIKGLAGMWTGIAAGAVIGGMSAGIGGALLGMGIGAVVGLFAHMFIASKLKAK